MAETSFPVAGGAGVTDAAYERLMGPVTGSGRYGFNLTSGQLSTPLIFADNTGRQVKAYANQSAIVRGFRWESGTTPPVLALDANTSGNPRLDLIVLRLDRSNYTVRLGKTNGTPGSVPAAPSPIQDASSSGVWELPVATVRVTSSGTTGLPSIASTDVTDLSWWLSPPGIVVKSGNGPIPSHGMFGHNYDTGRTYRAVGSTWQLLGEHGSMTKLAPAGGWTADNLYARRVNGFVYFQATITLNVAARPAGTDLTVCTLPATFRPDNHDIAGTGWMSPGQVCKVYISGSTGTVVVREYTQTFPQNGTLTISPITWPAADL